MTGAMTSWDCEDFPKKKDFPQRSSTVHKALQNVNISVW